MRTTSLLAGDLGGTNARFALADPATPGYTDVLRVRCADFESADAAIAHYLEQCNAAAPAVISLAVAGPVVGQSVRFTNNYWAVAATELACKFGGANVRLLNDFEAIACAVPHLEARDYLNVGLADTGPLPVDNYTVGVVGPGTGLGAVGLKRVGGVTLPIAGEGGHVGFAPASSLQVELLTTLRERFGRVSTERLVSGPGIENLYWALGRVHGQSWPERNSEQIFESAAKNPDGRAGEAVQVFFEVLGQFAGDYALSLGATDGIFIAGGIVPRYTKLFAASRYREGFEDKGRYRALMETIPMRLIVHENPGLLGAAVVAKEMAA